MVDEAYVFICEAMEIYYPEARIIKRRSETGQLIVEVIHDGQVPHHYIKALMPAFEKAFSGILIDRNYGLGKMKSPGVISQYLKDRYEYLAEERSSDHMSPAAMRAHDHSERVYFIYTHPWDLEYDTRYTDFVESTQKHAL